MNTDKALEPLVLPVSDAEWIDSVAFTGVEEWASTEPQLRLGGEPEGD